MAPLFIHTFSSCDTASSLSGKGKKSFFFWHVDIKGWDYSIIAWKVSKYGVFSGPYFPTFGLNTERYWDTPYLSVFRPNVGKHGPDKTPYLNTFHAVHYFKAVFYCNTERNQWWWIRTTWVLCGKKIKKARWNLFSRDNKVIENIPPTKGALRQHVLKSVLQSSIWRQSLRKDLNGRSTCQWGWQKI